MRKNITVRSNGPPAAMRIPVNHSVAPAKVLPSHVDGCNSELDLKKKPGKAEALDQWANYFAPSLDQLVPSAEQKFVARAISVEREVFYKDEPSDASADESTPRRIKITRRRVTLSGTIQDRQ